MMDNKQAMGGTEQNPGVYNQPYGGQYGMFPNIAPVAPQSSPPPPPAHYMTAVRMLSILLLVFGVMSCITGGVGIAMVDYAKDVATWPTQSGSGIWCGLPAIVAGILGIISSVMTFNWTSTLRCVYCAHVTIVMLAAGLTGANGNFSVRIWVDWTVGLQSWYCTGNYPHVVAMAAMNVAMSLVLLLTLLLLFISFCINAYLLSKVSKTDGGVVILQQQGIVIQPPPPNPGPM